MSRQFWKQSFGDRKYEIGYSAAGIFLGASISFTGLAVDAQVRGMMGLGSSWSETFMSTSMHSAALLMPVILGYGLSFVGRWRQRVDQTLRMTRDLETIARERSIRDAVSGLFNRTYLMQRLEEGLATRQWMQAGAVLYLADLDDFKLINDTYGHDVGDAVLIEIARRIGSVCTGADFAVRLGGDEFVIVHFPAAADVNDSADFATRVMASVGRDILLANAHIVPGISIGFARVGHDGMTCSDVLKAADLALYQAKSQVGDAFQAFEPGMRLESERRLRLESEMRLGIERDEFFLEYQPILGTASGAIRSFEVLLRWRHPERGIVSPGEFIPAAENSGLIIPLGQKVLTEACRRAATWPKPIGVCVNLSSVQFKDPDLLGHIEAALGESGLAPGRLDIEITESFLLDANGKVRATIDRLKALGIRLTMDDFGTGYSSLSALKNFPFDRLKVDRSFIANMSNDERDAEIVETIVRLSRSLRMQTVMEGVETAEQLAFARRIGVTEVQGFLFSRPVPLAAVEGMLAVPPPAEALSGVA
ncbi:putative bifunctional diguanylate cyclase/phosphodiesterase [Aureimonas psammosilenae]|uniref:putative bifunctional diguanylate cyclase/phosphodiesterase n=1 Tax=Aureimonas psammosilenae TaxID=2495496 RepID=UPI0012610E87|nr:bifunctional diguanylate cyclase/phosphodiesterase [Aureimonas psammosilenae]